MPIISRTQKVSIVEVWQHGKVIFKGNSLDVRKHFGITQQQFNRIRTTGIAVSRGSTPRPGTLYAIKIGEENKVIEANFKTNFSREEMDQEVERRKHETKEERRLRRKIQRDMARERLRNGN